MSEYKVLFLPGNKTAYFTKGTNFRDAALQVGIVIESTCAGIGTCAKCKVNVKEGVNLPTEVETQLLTPKELETGVRLSCQAHIEGNSVCVIPSESLLFGDQIMSEGRQGRFELSPDCEKIVLNVSKPQTGDRYFDFEQVSRALPKKVEKHAEVDLQLVREIPSLLRENDYTVTAVVDSGKLIAIEGGDTTQSLYGVALDIGTTTIVTKLVDLKTGNICAVSSSINPQKTYGADVVARVNYSVEHKGGLELLHRLVVKKINELISELCTESGVDSSEIYKMTVAGNTVMQHLFLNIIPRYIAFNPYTPAFRGPATIPAKHLDVNINDKGVIYAIPNLASFVGSDITSLLTVLDLDEEGDTQLVIDIGTNGEMVLGSRDRIICASSPAGPAWEGAYIDWGMRAALGAIERAEIIDGAELKFRTIGDVEPIGICGSGLMDLICEFLRAGIIHQAGKVQGSQDLDKNVSDALKSRIKQRESGGNEIIIANLQDEQNIALTQKDVREVQLAKAAIAAGVKVLMNELNITAVHLKKIYIAGAFGNHLRGKDAIEIGLIPEIPEDRIQFIGNAALAGAEAILLSKEAREKAESLSERIEYIEVSDREGFQDLFVDLMHFKALG